MPTAREPAGLAIVASVTSAIHQAAQNYLDLKISPCARSSPVDYGT
jgi:hypothetical protein